MPVTIDKYEYATDAAAQAAWLQLIESAFSQAYTGGGNLDQTYNIRMVLPAASISVSGSRIRLFFASYTNPGVVSGCAIGERSGSTDDFASAPTRVTFDGGSNGCTIPISGGKYSDWIDFDVDESKDYLVHLYYTGSAGNRGVAQVTLSGTRRYYKTGTGDDTLTQSVSYTGDANFNSVSALEIISDILTVASESTIKEDGSYSMKVVAPQTTSLNKTLTRTVSPTINLTDQDEIKLWVRASRTGTNFKIGLHDSGGTTTESNIAISSADTFEEKTIDISAVNNVNKDAIDSIVITITNADAENTIYLDLMMGYTEGEGGDGGGGVSRARIVNGV